jgi:large subunit ribosomal protein L24
MKTQKIHLKKGDKVIVLSGRDKGKTGIVDRVSVKTAQVLVEGVNIVKKHVKVSKQYPSGGVVELVKPMSVAKVQLICPNCGKATRVGYTAGTTEKSRVCKKCKKNIASPKGTSEVKTEKKTSKKEKNNEVKAK